MAVSCRVAAADSVTSPPKNEVRRLGREGLCTKWVEMVIGWIRSRDLLETSWEGLYEVLPIVIAKKSRMFTCVLSLPQWRCYRNCEPPVSHTNVQTGCGRSGVVLVGKILTPMHKLSILA